MRQPNGADGVLRVLCLEDSPADAELVRETLRSAGIRSDMRIASDESDFSRLLAGGDYDIILADYMLAGFDARAALVLAQAVSPTTPFICVSGSIGEEQTVELLKAGADDCVLKDRLARLPFAVRRAMDEAVRQKAMREAEDRNHEILEYGGVGVAYFDLEGRILLLNRRAVQNLGGDNAEQFIGRTVFELYGDDEGTAYADRIAAAAASPEPLEYVDRIELPIGLRWLHSVHTRVLAADGAAAGVHTYAQDITDLKTAELGEQKAAADWRSTFDAMRDSVAVFDAQGTVLRCNLATTQLLGKPFDEIIGRPCYELFHGTDDFIPGCPQAVSRATGQASTAFIEQGGLSLRVTFMPSLDASGGFLGGVHVMSDVSDLKESENRLRAALSGVVKVVGSVVEMRDPYTAGHESRVAEFSVGIAEEMGLDVRVVEEIRTAALVHDVGKMTVPAEILSKPGRLTPIEFELIKGHAEAGYRTISLAGMEGDIAEMVYQHHERCDGSGYPRGLHADQLLIGSKILMVADVVEAMSAHRPYRPALGIEAALAEIERAAGALYDADVCRACVKYFRGDGTAQCQTPLLR